MTRDDTIGAARSSARLLLAAFLLMSLVPRAWGMEQSQLREAAQRAIENDEVVIAEPMIRVEGGQLSYYLGGAQFDFQVNVDADHPDVPSNPMQIPLDNQLRVEVIRKYRFQRNPAFWTKVFREVEGVIAQQIALVEQSPEPDDSRLEKLRDLSESIWKIYEREMDALARSRNLTAVPMAAAAQGVYLVMLVTEPPQGEISLLHTLDARLAKLAKRPPKWQRVTNADSVQVGGKYWYSIRWGDRIVISPRPIAFEHEGTYTLR